MCGYLENAFNSVVVFSAGKKICMCIEPVSLDRICSVRVSCTQQSLAAAGELDRWQLCLRFAEDAGVADTLTYMLYINCVAHREIIYAAGKV